MGDLSTGRMMGTSLGLTMTQSASLEQQRALSALHSALDIPYMYFSDPMARAEENYERYITNLLPFCVVAYKQSDIIRLVASEAGAMRNDFKEPMLDWLHSSRKTVTDGDKVVGTARGLNICTQSCETPSVLEL